jgi:hypothetical protein
LTVKSVCRREVLSQHTMRKNSARAYIEAVLANPAYTTPDRRDPALSCSFDPIPAFGNRMLRVVHWPEGNDIFVVTAHWDR